MAFPYVHMKDLKYMIFKVFFQSRFMSGRRAKLLQVNILHEKQIWTSDSKKRRTKIVLIFYKNIGGG